MEQEITFQFLRGQSALILTTIVGIIVLSVLILRYRQVMRRWKMFGFTPTIRQLIMTRFLAPMLIIGLLGVAFAEPTLVRQETLFERSDVEVCYVFDNAGSMSASPQSGEPTRMERALSMAQELSRSDAMAGVPTCIGTFTSKPTLHLPATAHLPTILSVLSDIIVVGDPPPETRCNEGQVCTNLLGLKDAIMRFYGNSRSEARRFLIVFTDGETKSFNQESLANTFEMAKVEVLFVDLWSQNEEIFDVPGCTDTIDGCIDANYLGSVIGRQYFLGFVQLSESAYVAESDRESLAGSVSNMLGVPPEDSTIPSTTNEEREPLAWRFLVLSGILALLVFGEHLMGLTALRWNSRRKSRK